MYELVSRRPAASTRSATCWTASLDDGTFDEYKAEYGQTLVCGTARLGGFPVGVVANQHHRVKPAEGPLQFGGVIYVDSADKAARFVMDCNQDWLPIVFLQDVNGFMVGRDSGAGRDHQGRGEAGQRDLQQPRAEAHGDHSAARSGPATTPCAARRSTRGSSSPGRRPATP